MIVVLVEKRDSIVEEGHVQCHSKAEVIQMILLVPYDLFTQFLYKKINVLWVCYSIKLSREDGYWNVEILNRNKRSFISAIDLPVLPFAVIIKTVAFVIHHLKVVEECAIALTSWTIVCLDSKAIIVVDTFNKIKIKEQLTEFAIWNCAHLIDNCVISRNFWDPIINTEHINKKKLYCIYAGS